MENPQEIMVSSRNYSAINFKLLQMLSTTPRHVLDLGCGTGTTGAWMKKEWGSTVYGVTFSASEGEAAARLLDHVEVADLNTWRPSDDKK